MSSVVAGEVHRHECNQGVFAFDAFATVVKGGKFEFEANYSASKFFTEIGGYRGEGSCCTPRLVKCWGENDGNTFEKVLPTILTTERIVSEDVIAANVNVKLVTFFPRLLQ